MFTASDIDQLRESLPECDFAADSLAVPALHPYLQFYGINPLEFPAHGGAALHYSAGTFDSAGFRIFCQYFCVSRDACRGTVFVLHGYYDHGGLYGKLLRYLLHKGYGVVLFDLPGHGLSSGDRAAITSFTQYTDVLEAVAGTR
jgi:alpha-beta hydrolase superfamily lysophospholipase